MSAAATGSRTPLSLRILNLVTAATAIASALAVLVSTLGDPGYRAHYRDAPWFVVAYATFYGVVVYAFASARRRRLAQALALVKALAAYAFIVAFPAVGQSWMVWTPGRYVYQLFDWGPEARTLLIAYVFLGRGLWNTVNVFALTRDLWIPLRMRRPLFGRLVTIVPVSLTVLFTWLFFALARMNATEFSSEAHEVAQLVADGIDCDELQKKAGTTTTDVRERNDRRYDVTIGWDCTDLRIIVKAPDGRLGTARTPRPECCTPPPARSGG